MRLSPHVSYNKQMMPKFQVLVLERLKSVKSDSWKNYVSVCLVERSVLLLYLKNMFVYLRSLMVLQFL